ncbi:DUF2115 family protein [Methanolobus mangrovi]|uniref:UPF0305 protein RE476_03115 n=1 Tax=Methanolobus mangrovi TaxID=3072977 RepID=A0AA51YHR8_9EURY|nr:DUF2115 family protein [Methanolobus mangrovi]WMW23432.1 DUF2115 family protein [Methanolobus mangrovi]
MNSCELLFSLKKEASNLSSEHLIKINENKTEDIQSTRGSLRHNISCLARYNHKMFSELTDRDHPDISKEIDIEKLEDFTYRINKYMDEYAPDQRDLKEYIRIISTYLAFIVKEPLHPPGMFVTVNRMIFKNGSSYYCPVKSKHILEALSLCKYCVCKAID